jgi:hypothetical protein
MKKAESNLLSSIAQKLDDHVETFKVYVKNNDEKRAEEREDRRKWREEIDSKFTGLDRRIAPVVRDHLIITRGSAVAATSIAGIWGAVKAWFVLKDHLGK